MCPQKERNNLTIVFGKHLETNKNVYFRYILSPKKLDESLKIATTDHNQNLKTIDY